MCFAAADVNEWPTSAERTWPGEQLCYSCFYAAMHTRGVCPQCGHDGILAGLATDAIRRPICLSCARIPGDFTCRGCGNEGDFYRRGTCARCSLRQDLTALMIDGAQHRDAMAPIVEALCRVDRPASILTWKRSPRVQELLTGLANGEIPLTHVGLDEAGSDKAVNHLRSMLEHAGVLAARDEPLARFERWLSVKLEVVTEPAVRGPVEQFATWHHLRRLRQTSVPGQDSAAAVRYAKQEITEAIKFLTWLHSTHHRTLATCLQHDVDEWLVSGPTTRSKIRNLLAWAKKARLNRSVHITHQQAPPSRSLTQQQRLAWLRELLTGDSETLALPRRRNPPAAVRSAPDQDRGAAEHRRSPPPTMTCRSRWGESRSPSRSRSQTCSSTTPAAGPISEPPVGSQPARGCFPVSRPAGTWPHK